MSGRPTVSCIISAHNYGRYLGAAIESVLAQSYPAELMQIIVVDDGSTDDTPEVAARYRDRVTYIHKPNGGLLSSINRGLEAVTGELISFLSADDTWVPTKTERQVGYLAAHSEVGLVHSDMVVLDDRGVCLHPSFLEAFGVPAVEGSILPVLLQRNVVSGGPLMVRASLVDRFAPIVPELAAWEDWWIAFHVAQVAEIGLIREPLYRYRRHSDNMNLGASGQKLQPIVRAELPFRRYMVTSLPPGVVTPGELLAGYSAMVHLASNVSHNLGVPLESLLPVDGGRREACRLRIEAADARVRSGETTLAACDLVAALAHNPWDGEVAARIQSIEGGSA